MNKGKKRRGVVGLTLGATVLTSVAVTGAGPSGVEQAPGLPHPGEGNRQTMRTFSNDDSLRFREVARRTNDNSRAARVEVQLLPTAATEVRPDARSALVPGSFRWNAVTGRPNTCPISVVGGPVSRTRTVTWTIELSVPLREVRQGPRHGGQPPVQQLCSGSFRFRVTEAPTGESDEDDNPIFEQTIRAIG